MHYYTKNLGDYAKKTGRLSLLQHGVYNFLMDCCYDREDFPTRDDAIEWTWASSKEEIEAVDFILGRYFDLQDDGKYVQKRIAEEIEKYREFKNKQREKAKKGGRPPKPKPPKEKPGGNPAGSEENPSATQRGPEKTLNQEPGNHKPVNQGGGDAPDGDPGLPALGVVSGHVRAAAGRPVAPIPDDFALTDRMRDRATVEGYAHLDLEAATEEFVDFWKSRGDAKADWEAAWRGDMRKKSAMGWTAPQRAVATGNTRGTSLQQDLQDTSWAD